MLWKLDVIYQRVVWHDQAKTVLLIHKIVHFAGDSQKHFKRRLQNNVNTS